MTLKVFCDSGLDRSKRAEDITDLSQIPLHLPTPQITRWAFPNTVASTFCLCPSFTFAMLPRVMVARLVSYDDLVDGPCARGSSLRDGPAFSESEAL